MHPYLPYAAIPIAVITAWFGASHWSVSDPGRYQVSRVAQIEDPSVVTKARSEFVGKPEIRVKAFLPHVPPKPPAPDPTLVLHSVMTGGDVSLATINGQIVKEGDLIEGYKVRRITTDGVDLAGRGKNRRLPMRSLHELPPPVIAEEVRVKKNNTAHSGKTDLNQDFWKIFDSLKL